MCISTLFAVGAEFCMAVTSAAVGVQTVLAPTELIVRTTGPDAPPLRIVMVCVNDDDLRLVRIVIGVPSVHAPLSFVVTCELRGIVGRLNDCDPLDRPDCHAVTPPDTDSVRVPLELCPIVKLPLASVTERVVKLPP